MLQLPVGLQHGIRVDCQCGHHILDGREPVARHQVAEPEGVLHLPDNLLVRRHPRARVEPEDDRGLIDLFIYHHSEMVT